MTITRQIRFPEIVVVCAGSLSGWVQRYNHPVPLPAVWPSALARFGSACGRSADCRRGVTIHHRERLNRHRRFARDSRASASGTGLFSKDCRGIATVARGFVGSHFLFPAARHGFPNRFGACAKSFRVFPKSFGQMPESFCENPPVSGAFPAAFRENPPVFRVFAKAVCHFPESFREIAERSGERPEAVRETDFEQ